MADPSPFTFQRTKKAAELFSNLMSCANPDCREKSSELQYLGTACKHAFCWDCINAYAKVSLPSCPLCFAPLEPALPTNANLFNNLSHSLDNFVRLLCRYEEAVINEGLDADDLAQTQRMLDTNLATTQQRTVDEFISTQTHVQDVYDSSGLEDSRPNSDEISFSNEDATDVVSECRGAVTRSRSGSRSSRSRSGSLSARPVSTMFDELNANEEKALTPSRNRKTVITDSVPKLTEPLATSTQNPHLYMTQYENSTTGNDSCYDEPIFMRPPAVKPMRSFEFDKQPKATFGERNKKPNDDLWNQAMGVSAQKNSIKNETVISGSSGVALTVLAPPESSVDLRETPKTRSKSKPSHHGLSDTPSETGEGSSTSKSPGSKKESSRKSHGHRPGEKTVINAVIMGNMNHLVKAVNAGCDVNEYDPLTGTPLYAAVERGRLDMCKFLVENGAIINAHCGPDCNTALHLAVCLEDEPIVQYLLSKGASRQIRNIRLKTPCDMAQAASPLRKLVEKYRSYPRQPSIPPRQPEKYNVVVDEGIPLTEMQKNKLSKLMTIQPALEPTTTHYVVCVDKKGFAIATHNLLFAMLRGIHVVSSKWLKECFNRDELFTDDLRFEVQYLSYNGYAKSEGAVNRCRRSKEKLEPGLLRGCKFFLAHSRFSKFGSKAQLVEVIRAAGGEVLTREPQVDPSDPLPFHAPDSISPYFILYDIACSVPLKLSSNEHYILATADWLFDCLYSYEFKKPY